jgi:hypothetical protein
MSDEDARQAVLSRLGTRLDAVDDARRAAEARGDTTRLAKLDALARLLDFQIQLEETDPEPLPGREDEVILLGGPCHGQIVTRVPSDLATLRIFTAVYTWDTTEPAIRPRRFLWPPR